MKQQSIELVIKERVTQVLQKKGISVKRLAEQYSMSVRTLNDQINGTAKIGCATLIMLADLCQDISTEWLLRGTGEMLISSVVPTEGQPRDDRENTETTTATTRQRHDNEPMDNATLTAALEQIEQLQTELAQQKEFNALQREYVADLKERIAEYQERISELKEIIHELKKAQHAATVPHAKNA